MATRQNTYPAPSAGCPKADSADYLGRFREIISDPLNILIPRDPLAGTVKEGYVRLHNGLEAGFSSEQSYYGEFSQILVFNRGVHEPLEEYCFQMVLNCLPSKPFMLELGSYWAHYSMWMLHQHPDATVTMVEPDAGNMAVGSSNFARNGFSGEFIEDIVASDRFAVDRFMRARNISKINVLHADIQGAECSMLEGCHNALSNGSIDWLFISTHSQELHASVLQLLDKANYRIDVSSDFDHETTSFDGLVVASNRSAPSVFEKFNPLGRSQIQGASVDLLLSRLSDHLDSPFSRNNGADAAKR